MANIFRVEINNSPNKSSRGFARPVCMLVHATVSDSINGTIEWFRNHDSKVSADFVVGKDGHIVRMVPKGWNAWHAGVCLWQGKARRDFNKISYGVELVNMNDGVDPYPDIQLEALAFIYSVIQKESPTVSWIRRHADLAIPHGRKSDPKGLSVAKIYEVVKQFQPHVHLT